MHLSENYADPSINLLPRDGIVHYYGKIFDRPAADHYFRQLHQNIAWENDMVIIFGKTIITRRKVAWYGEKTFEYRYSNVSKHALPWTKELVELKNRIEKITVETYNSCLLNLYHDGTEGMAWHSDDEPVLKKNGAIASLSFGAERRFDFRHRFSGDKVQIRLEHGSLLLMKGTTQTYWLHQLPVSRRIVQPRINLTFRTILSDALK